MTRSVIIAFAVALALTLAMAWALWHPQPARADTHPVSELLDGSDEPTGAVYEELVIEPPAAPPPAPLTIPEVIDAAAARYGVSAAWLRRVAWCESTWRPWVTGRSGEMGLFQYLPSTYAWMSVAAGWAGSNPYDATASANVAAWAFSRGYASHWSCS